MARLPTSPLMTIVIVVAILATTMSSSTLAAPPSLAQEVRSSTTHQVKDDSSINGKLPQSNQTQGQTQSQTQTQKDMQQEAATTAHTATTSIMRLLWDSGNGGRNGDNAEGARVSTRRKNSRKVQHPNKKRSHVHVIKTRAAALQGSSADSDRERKSTSDIPFHVILTEQDLGDLVASSVQNGTFDDDQESASAPASPTSTSTEGCSFTERILQQFDSHVPSWDAIQRAYGKIYVKAMNVAVHVAAPAPNAGKGLRATSYNQVPTKGSDDASETQEETKKEQPKAPSSHRNKSKGKAQPGKPVDLRTVAQSIDATKQDVGLGSKLDHEQMDLATIIGYQRQRHNEKRRSMPPRGPSITTLRSNNNSNDDDLLTIRRRRDKLDPADDSNDRDLFIIDTTVLAKKTNAGKRRRRNSAFGPSPTKHDKARRRQGLTATE